MVERQRLLDLLDEASDASVVLLTAPAGYGKSVLLERWTSSMDEVTPARISLDQRNNEAGRFWQTLVARIEDRVPDKGMKHASWCRSSRQRRSSSLSRPWVEHSLGRHSGWW